MTIMDLIRDYGKEYSPYMSGLVNHLPMGQLALYELTGDIEEVESYSQFFTRKYDIDKVREDDIIEVTSIKECLGKRDMYESCLNFLEKNLDKENLDSVIGEVINDYQFGMSSGLFHTLIRLAYAVEGYKKYGESLEEIRRALAYYITGYKKANVFGGYFRGERLSDGIERIGQKDNIEKILSRKESLGQTMKSLYGSEDYLNSSLLVDGDSKDKVKKILELAISSYLNTKSIVALHCITGIHAITVLKEYYRNYDRALDLMTTCVITHILAGDLAEFKDTRKCIDLSWTDIIKKGSKSKDVHAIKLTYSASVLSPIYDVGGLKQSALVRIG